MPCTEIPVYGFTLYKGDDKTKSFRYKAADVAVDITAYVIVLECPISSLTKIADIVDAVDGRYDFVFDQADTVDLTESRVKYEVVFYPNGLAGDKFTKHTGSINLINEVVP